MSSISRLKIIGEGSKPSYLLYECECGEIKEIYKYNVIAGKTKSCGCLLREKLVFGGGNYCEGRYASQVKNKHEGVRIMGCDVAALLPPKTSSWAHVLCWMHCI